MKSQTTKNGGTSDKVDELVLCIECKSYPNNGKWCKMAKRFVFSESKGCKKHEAQND